ncbi:MAG TPA: ABC transporter substrate-binding protein [Chloroflexota bacterium]|nr:ABC transporter substrate-binding protein [Chloroflexota bacterium]
MKLPSTIALTLLLAACGGGAAPASSPPAESKPAAASALASASAKPAASASAKPATSGGASATGKAMSAKMAWVALTANQMLWPTAKEAGYFGKYGLNVDLQYIQGSGTATQTQLAGDVDFTNVAGSAVVGAQAAGQDIVMVAGFLNQAIFRIMATKDINKVTDLKGKTVAVTKIGNADFFAWQTVLKKEGIKEGEIKFVNTNDAQGQVAAFSSGQVQAIALSPPNDVLTEKVGGHLLLDITTLKIPEQNNGMAVTRRYLNANRPVVTAALKASIESMARWQKDPAFIKGVIKQYLKQDDQRFIDVGYDAYKDLWPKAPYPSKEGFQEVIEQVATQNPKASDLKVDQLMDTSIVKELEDTGFIKQAYGS